MWDNVGVTDSRATTADVAFVDPQGFLLWLRDALNTLAVIADDPDEWVVDDDHESIVIPGGDDDWSEARSILRAEHIARHDPRSVLARVEAERAIVELHWSFPLSRQVLGTQFAEHKRENDPDSHGCGHCTTDDGPLVSWPCPTLRWLAYGHRFDIDGYDQRWALEPAGTAT